MGCELSCEDVINLLKTENAELKQQLADLQVNALKMGYDLGVYHGRVNELGGEQPELLSAALLRGEA